MTKIDPSFYLSNQQFDRTPSPELGKDEFMRILMTQLQNQDPLNPMEDRDFVAQMATFSSLEQMMQMASSINTLVQNQLMSPVIQYSHMIGKEVTYEKIDPDTNEKSIVSGIVKSVSQEEGWAILELEDGTKVYADGIISVKDSSEDTTEEIENE